MRTRHAANIILFGLIAARASAIPTFSLTLKQAETRALANSDKLKSLHATAESALEKSRAQFGKLLPRLDLNGFYQYDTNVPKVSLGIPNIPAIQIGSHNNYAVGPSISYTLWDTGAQHDAYKAAKLLAESNKDNEDNERAQTIFRLRTAYSRLQFALENLKLLNSSLDLAKAQNRDVETNYRAGAASRLDLVDSRREVLNYELQLKQQQTEVQSDFQDLLDLVHASSPVESARPGPPGLPEADLTINLDSLAESISTATAWPLQPPDDSQPELRSLSNLAKSADAQAKSERAVLFPKLNLSASAMVQYPNQMADQTIEQNTFTATLSMPLFDGNLARHLAAASRRDAASARYQKEQAKLDLTTAYQKIIHELNNLKEQQKLASLDVQSSVLAAKLYYRSYKAGKINLIDVQGANNRALLAKLNAARIDTQLLNEIYLAESISGKESP